MHSSRLSFSLFAFLCGLVLLGLSASPQPVDARIARKIGGGALPVPTNFNLTQFFGRFYQAYSDAAVMDTFESKGVCIFAEYEPLADGTVGVYNEMRVGQPDGELLNITGFAIPDGSGTPGHLTVTLSGQPFPAPYWIVVTGPVVDDKYDYVIVTDGLEITMWVLVRDIQRYFELYDAKVQDELKLLGFTQFWNSPLKTVQDGCSYENGKGKLASKHKKHKNHHKHH